jgi:hypothetical protein
MLQVGKTKKWRDRRAGGGNVHRAIAHLDFLFGLFEILCVRISR